MPIYRQTRKLLEASRTFRAITIPRYYNKVVNAMPSYKRKSSKYSGSTKYARTSGTYRSSRSRLMAARKGARLGYRKSGYKPRSRVGAMTAKYVDTPNTTYACSTTAVVTHIAIIPQGPDEINRLGRNVLLKSFQMRGELQANTAGVQAMARIMLVYDRQPNRALAAITDILQSGSVYGMKNLDNQDRFVILMDKLFSVIGTNTSVGIESAQRAIQKYIKLGSLVANYQVGATGAIGEVNTGALLLVTIGDMVAGTTAPNFGLITRTRFVDV